MQIEPKFSVVEEVCHVFSVMPIYPGTTWEYKMRFNRVENMHEKKQQKHLTDFPCLIDVAHKWTDPMKS